jgi:hypothetical protein
MSEFSGGRQGPWPSANRQEAQRAHEQDIHEEAEHEHEVKDATGSKRRRWWLFGKRRGE